jgi:streptomycin 6-kinase
LERETPQQLHRRVEERVTAWHITIDRVTETATSVLVFGRRNGLPVVAKIVRRHIDEWRAAEVLHAFAGRGVVRVYDWVEGAMLVERLVPGSSAAALAINGRDDEATAILTQLIEAMTPGEASPGVSTVADWGRGFDDYLVSRETFVPRDLLLCARDVYTRLCRSQSRPRLLHGDFHHHNVLFDAGLGWLAVDAKGVIGEPEYEIAAALRNPYEQPHLFMDRDRLARRIERFAGDLHLNAERILGWAFAQAVLAVIWTAGDDVAIEPGDTWLAFAEMIRPMLPDAGG